MIDAQTVARDYLAVWNDGDDRSRRQKLADGWRTDARYADPMMAGEGQDGIATMIAKARDAFPGHAFTLAGIPDGHGPFVRFSWSLAATGGGASVAHGTDVVRMDEAGRIAEVIGFLEAPAG